MKIQTLVCRMDGTQATEEHEVADDWFKATEAVPAPTPEDDRDAMAVDHEYRLTTLELGVTDNAAVQNT